MTKEEAVEVLLAGPWITCTLCEGVARGGRCKRCFGFEYIENGNWHEATRMLGVDALTKLLADEADDVGDFMLYTP